MHTECQLCVRRLPYSCMANAWELHQVTLTRTSAFGLGMAVAGGVDSPYVPGETAIVISDVLRDGPAEGKLW